MPHFRTPRIPVSRSVEEAIAKWASGSVPLEHLLQLIIKSGRTDLIPIILAVARVVPNEARAGIVVNTFIYNVSDNSQRYTFDESPVAGAVGAGASATSNEANNEQARSALVESLLAETGSAIAYVGGRRDVAQRVDVLTALTALDELLAEARTTNKTLADIRSFLEDQWEGEMARRFNVLHRFGDSVETAIGPGLRALFKLFG